MKQSAHFVRSVTIVCTACVLSLLAPAAAAQPYEAYDVVYTFPEQEVDPGPPPVTVEYERDLYDKLWEEWVSVADYGAVSGDDIDDTNAFRAAILAVGNSGVIYVPRGVYKITSSLNLSGDPLAPT